MLNAKASLDKTSSPRGFFTEKIALHETAKAIHELIPEGFLRAQLDVRIVNPISNSDLKLFRHDESFMWLDEFSSVISCSEALRQVMYKEEAGTWFSATIVVSIEGNIDASYNYDTEPEWDFPISAECYLTDQEAFPRDDGQIPEWLKTRLAEGMTIREKNSLE